jgi:hypothetical protein
MPEPVFGTPSVGRNADGRLEVFMMNGGFGGAHIWQTAPGNGWSEWSEDDLLISNQFEAPSVAANADGRLELFGGASLDGGTCTHQWQVAPNNGWIPGGVWTLGGQLTSSPIVARNADGRLEVFARGTDGTVQHIWQDAPAYGAWAGTKWSEWDQLGDWWISDLGRTLILDGGLIYGLAGEGFGF